jgi:hypothetical protein
VHGRVGAFYAPYAREGNQILQMKPFKSVNTIRGYASISNRSKHRKIPSLAPLKNQGLSRIDFHEPLERAKDRRQLSDCCLTYS